VFVRLTRGPGERCGVGETAATGATTFSCQSASRGRGQNEKGKWAAKGEIINIKNKKKPPWYLVVLTRR
jgi:hypothetical protein